MPASSHTQGRFRSCLSRGLAGFASVSLLAACETPPDNMARFWDERSVQAAGDGAVPSPPSAEVDPTTDPVIGAGGYGGLGPIAGASGAGGVTGFGGGVGGAGTGGVDAAGSDGGDAASVNTVDAQGTTNYAGCLMNVSVTTTTTGLDYSPDNVGAVWIADGNGRFVKTLAVWANRRMSHLNKWVAATTAAGRARETTDAVTGATASKHSAHVSKWDCTGAGRARVPLGTYQLCSEMNESNDPSIAYQCVSFENAGTAFKLTPPDANNFKSRVLDYAPR